MTGHENDFGPSRLSLTQRSCRKRDAGLNPENEYLVTK